MVESSCPAEPRVDEAALAAHELGAYFALMEVSSLLQHAVDQHLRAEGDLSHVQFQVLARLSNSPHGRLRMTDLADGLVHSRSGLTYQAGLLEKAGLVSRCPSAEDERSVTVSVTPAGRALVARVLPGHIAVVRRLLLDPVSDGDLAALGGILGRIRDEIRCGPPRSAASRARRGSDAC